MKDERYVVISNAFPVSSQPVCNIISFDVEILQSWELLVLIIRVHDEKTKLKKDWKTFSGEFKNNERTVKKTHRYSAIVIDRLSIPYPITRRSSMETSYNHE
jgi:hypothetical protein